MQDEILTQEEAEALLRVAPDALAPFIESGELVGRNIAGAWRTTRRAVICFVEGVPLDISFCEPGDCCDDESPESGTQGRCCC
jgi:hypothetical protein